MRCMVSLPLLVSISRCAVAAAGVSTYMLVGVVGDADHLLQMVVCNTTKHVEDVPMYSYLLAEHVSLHVSLHGITTPCVVDHQ